MSQHQLFTFTNKSSISAGSLTYLWRFGSGITSTATSPTHKYNTAGNFTVTLIATSGFACADSTTENFYRDWETLWQEIGHPHTNDD